MLLVVHLPSCVWLFATPRTAAHQASLSLTISCSLPKFLSIESVMPSNHLILCHPLLLLPSIFSSFKVFCNESAVHIRWPKYWSFSFSISPSKEYSELISFKIDWFDILVSQGALKSLLQHPSSKASALRLSAIFFTSFLLSSIIPLYVFATVHNSPVDWHLGCFQFGAYKCSFWEHSWPRLYVDTLSFLLDKYLGEEWQVQWQCTFNFLRNCHMVFQSGCPILLFTSSIWEFQWLHVSVDSWYGQVFFRLAILVGMQQYLIVVLICISLMTNNVEHLSMCLFAIYIPFFWWHICPDLILAPYPLSDFKQVTSLCFWFCKAEDSGSPHLMRLWQCLRPQSPVCLPPPTP